MTTPLHPMPQRALVRRVAPSLSRAVVRVAATIDYERARAQHQAYIEALEASGVRVQVLDAADAYPDCVFIEDCAVVVGDRALITRCGHPSRRGEVEAVRDALAQTQECEVMMAPAVLDGGDVMRVGDQLFVGVGNRTNSAGVEALRRCFEPLGMRVREVVLPEGELHLKCLCSPLDDARVLACLAQLPPDPFGAQVEVIDVAAEDAYASNVLCLGDLVLAPQGFPRVHDALRRVGFEVIALDNSELRKADGALTCMSILLDPPVAR